MVTKRSWQQYPSGSPERVLAHYCWRCRRGRHNPSELLSGVHSTNQSLALAVMMMTMKKDGHQLGSDISVPSDPDLIGKVLTNEQICHVYESVGQSDLERLATVSHGDLGQNPDWGALAEQEGADLDILRQAISEATGKQKVWIIGFASDFARGLLTVVDRAEV